MIVLPVQPPSPIPKIVHQVWIGGEVTPRVQSVYDVWRESLPGWDVILWTEETMKGTVVEALAKIIEPLSDDYRLKADLYRLAILAFYGGIYADSDALPLKPLDDYVGDRRGWIGSGPETFESPTIINAHFGMPPGHPFLSRAWNLAHDALRRGVMNPHWVAGPRQFRTAMKGYDDVDLYWHFVTTVDGKSRRMVRESKIDMDDLRERFPDSPILHVVLR